MFNIIKKVKEFWLDWRSYQREMEIYYLINEPKQRIKVVRSMQKSKYSLKEVRIIKKLHTLKNNPF